jgi:hypothetical protein
MRKHTNISKSLKLRIVRVIYRARQITHRVITKNKRDQVIVTMHASKLKMNTGALAELHMKRQHSSCTTWSNQAQEKGISRFEARNHDRE